jgi:DNA polymerase IV
MQRNIMHIDLDTFFVSVERLNNPQLLGKPVLVGGSSDRGVVAACSYEARSFGIHSAMPMKQAIKLCPEAKLVKGNHAQYSKFSHMVTNIIHEAVPSYEKTSIDEFYVDYTGMDKFFGCYKMASELRQKIIRETHLPISFALSSNKTVSKIGTGEAKPNGQKMIPFGYEKNFLAPLSVKKIPMVGKKTYQLLKNIGVERICTLQQMPCEIVQQLLGIYGANIWYKANGIDNSPIIQYNERKSISTERTFDKDTIDATALKGLLVSMTEKLGFQLRDEGKLTSCITIKIRYADFKTYTMQATIPYTSLDHVLIEQVKQLFDKLCQKRMLIRLIGIRLSHLIYGTYQYNLFENTDEKIKLYQAMDSIKKRFGKNAISRASNTSLKRND